MGNEYSRESHWLRNSLNFVITLKIIIFTQWTIFIIDISQGVRKETVNMQKII
jgi:hypothetical protein